MSDKGFNFQAFKEHFNIVNDGEVLISAIRLNLVTSPHMNMGQILRECGITNTMNKEQIIDQLNIVLNEDRGVLIQLAHKEALKEKGRAVNAILSVPELLQKLGVEINQVAEQIYKTHLQITINTYRSQIETIVDICRNGGEK